MTDPMDNLVECIARAIYRPEYWDKMPEDKRDKQEDYREDARRVLADLYGHGLVIVPRKPTEAMLAALSGEVPYVARRNKMYDDGRIYEVVRMDNEDWRECVTDDQTVMGRFPNDKEASALFERLRLEYLYAAMLKAAEPS